MGRNISAASCDAKFEIARGSSSHCTELCLMRIGASAISIVHRTEKEFATTGKINHPGKGPGSLDSLAIFIRSVECSVRPFLLCQWQLWNFRDSCVARLGGSLLTRHQCSPLSQKSLPL